MSPQTSTPTMARSIKLHDMCLRDGMHPKRHQITLEQMCNIARGLDESRRVFMRRGGRGGVVQA